MNKAIIYLLLLPLFFAACSNEESSDAEQVIGEIESLGGSFDRDEQKQISSITLRNIDGSSRLKFISLSSPHLQVLAFENSDLRNASTFAGLMTLPKVEELFLRNCKVDGSFPWDKLPSLHWLVIQDAELDDSVFSKLSGLSVGVLKISTNFDSQGLGYISHLQTLKVLNASDTRIAPDGIAHMSNLLGLENVGVSRGFVDGEFVRLIDEMPDLVSIVIEGDDVEELRKLNWTRKWHIVSRDKTTLLIKRKDTG